MEISATIIENEELQEMINDLLEHDIAKRKREELSTESFKEWIYDVIKNIFAQLGYKLQSMEEFWKDIKLSVTEGWEDGREQARREAELRRKKRQRRYQ